MNIYRRVIMPPLRELSASSVFMLPKQAQRSCITINIRILRSQCGVRGILAHDLVNLGIGHGFVRRMSSTEVEVLVVLPNVHRIDLNRIAEYFGIKWNVVDEDFRVDQNNTAHIDFLSTGLKVYKSTIADPQNRSLDEDLELVSVDGFSVISES